MYLFELVIARIRSVRLYSIPCLFLYFAAGSSALTAVAGMFFVKDYLGLSAEFLASLGFWAVIPWTLKLPLGYLCDRIGPWRPWIAVVGAAMIVVSLGIMLGLFTHRELIERWATAQTWYLLATLAGTAGYAFQDVVADAMTMEAVSIQDACAFAEHGSQLSELERQNAHQTMQTIGRAATVAGGLLVSIANITVFSLQDPLQAPLELYTRMYLWACLIPVCSLVGLILEWWVLGRTTALGPLRQVLPLVAVLTSETSDEAPLDRMIVFGSIALVTAVLFIGLAPIGEKELLVFLCFLAVVLLLLQKLTQSFSEEVRRMFLGTALVVFAFRAVPSVGSGLGWWEIDVLGFDEAFIARLMLIGSIVSLCSMGVYRRFLVGRSLAFSYAALTILMAGLSVPIVGMYYGLHEWTAAVTHGLITQRTIAIADVALDSPLGQAAMIPALAWAAHRAPKAHQFTFFALMMSFLNLSLLASSLLTKLLNHYFVVKQAVIEPGTGIIIPADYSQLGPLLWITLLLGLIMPLGTIALVRFFGLQSE